MSFATAEKLRKLRQQIIDQKQDSLSGIAGQLQNALFDTVVERFLDLFEVNNGNIVYNHRNITATEAIETVFEEFNDKEMKKFIRDFVGDIKNITELNTKYYEQLADNLQKFRDTASKVKDLMYFRLGINSSGTLIKKGFLDSFIRDTGLKLSVKKTILDAVTKQTSQRELIQNLKQNIKGNDKVDGALLRKIKDTIFDVYQQHDRATSKQFAVALDLKVFRYTGGLIDSSRQFCIDRNGKIFTTDEAKDWENDPNLPLTTIERESGGKPIGYDPLIDCGRWRCRHHVNYISKNWAIKERPDLEGKI